MGINFFSQQRCSSSWLFWCCHICILWRGRLDDACEAAAALTVFCPPSESRFLATVCLSRVPLCHNSKRHSHFLPREANFPHMFLTFIPSNSPHMFVKTCMLCALSGPICSHAFSPMSPALPGGLSPSLTLFIQSEQLGPSQPKQRGVRGRGMGGELILQTSGLTKRWNCLFCSLLFALLSSDALPWVSKNVWGWVVSRSGQPDRWTDTTHFVPSCFQFLFLFYLPVCFAFCFIISLMQFMPFQLWNILWVWFWI